jgi:muramoyltetrapeptide carboxypeptidase LdcA involved in peptidoglycan recycling
MKTALLWFLYTITTIWICHGVHFSSEVDLDDWSHQFSIYMILLIKKDQPSNRNWLDIDGFAG